MADQTGSPPAGWYDDPSAPNQQRWWDGAQWSSSTRPLLDGPPPAMPPPASAPPGPSPFDQTTPLPVQPAPSGGGRRGRTAMWLVLFGAGFVLLLGGCVALLAAGSDGGSDDAAVEVAPLPGTEADEVTPDEPAQPIDDGADEPDAEPAGGSAMGTREDPLPYGEAVDLTWNTIGDADGSRWTTVIGPPRDITDAVLAENEFNDPPPDGVRFVGFDVELTLIESTKEPLAPSFNFSWEVLGGSTARVYDPTTIETDSFGCGVIPDAFDDFAEVFTGGTLAGTVCIPLPAEDLDHPGTRVALHFVDDERAVFGP